MQFVFKDEYWKPILSVDKAVSPEDFLNLISSVHSMLLQVLRENGNYVNK